jgi:hypothetical protein
LLGIFLFPVIFQSIHTAGHEKACCAEHENSCGTGLPQKDLQTNSIAEQSQEEQCPVCNYQFPVNKLPELSLYSSIVPVVTGLVCEIILPAAFRITFSTKSPRAPPSVI